MSYTAYMILSVVLGLITGVSLGAADRRSVKLGVVAVAVLAFIGLTYLYQH